jgi:hypothetical protein
MFVIKERLYAHPVQLNTELGRWKEINKTTKSRLNHGRIDDVVTANVGPLAATLRGFL